MIILKACALKTFPSFVPQAVYLIQYIWFSSLNQQDLTCVYYMHFTANSNGENVPVAFNQSFICNSAQCVWKEWLYKNACKDVWVYFSFIKTWGASKYCRILKDQSMLIDCWVVNWISVSWHAFLVFDSVKCSVIFTHLLIAHHLLFLFCFFSPLVCLTAWFREHRSIPYGYWLALVV